MNIKLPVTLEGKQIKDADGMIIAMATCLTGDEDQGERSVESAFAIAAEIVTKLNQDYHPVKPENERTSGLTQDFSFNPHSVFTNFQDGERVGYSKTLMLNLVGQQKITSTAILEKRRGTIRHRVPGSDHYSVAWDDHSGGLYGYENGLGLARVKADGTVEGF